jgi:hypothetical protein
LQLILQRYQTNEIENKDDSKNALNEQSLIFLKNAKNNKILVINIDFVTYGVFKNKHRRRQIPAGTKKTATGQ